MNLNMGKRGIAQLGEIYYDDGRFHNMVWASPSLKFALNEGQHIQITGRLRGDCIDIVTMRNL